MESALYGIYAFVVFVSEISLVRFLIRQHLVRKYCMHALSVKNFMSAFFLYLQANSQSQKSGTGSKANIMFGCHRKVCLCESVKRAFLTL